MPRRTVYLKDKIDREVQDIVEIEIQKGANSAEVNFSSMVNELVRLGLMVYKSKEDGSSFDLEGYRRDLIRKVTGSREGIMILTALISDMYIMLKGENYKQSMDELLNSNITAINDAENDAESNHFVNDEK
jgi:hypothetical protein